MASISLQLATVLQGTIIEAPVRQSTINVTPVNANQAQAVPTPLDTVTLTSQAAQGQQAQENPQQQTPFQQAFLFNANAQGFARANPAPNGTVQQEGARTATQAAAATAAQPPDLAPPAFPPGQGGDAANTVQTPNQQLQVLDQTLQQLGINPNSISLSDRLAMLAYASDPAALEQFVQQLQGTQNPAPATTTTTTVGNQGPAQNPPPQTQSANATQPPAAAPTDGDAQTSAATQTPPENPTQNNSFGQFQDVQLTFSTLGEYFEPSPGVASNSPNQNGTQINITI